MLEPPAVVAGFNDVAVVCEPVEHGRGHLAIAEHRWPLTEPQVGGDDDRSALVELADEVEQQLAAGLREGEIAELVEDQEVEAAQEIRVSASGSTPTGTMTRRPFGKAFSA